MNTIGHPQETSLNIDVEFVAHSAISHLLELVVQKSERQLFHIDVLSVADVQ